MTCSLFRRANLCLIFGFVLTWTCHALASPVEYIVSREVFRDVTGQLSIETIEQQAFQPFTGIFAGGYTKDTIWLRLKVQPAHDGRPLVLRILPSYLNELTLYAPDPNTQGNWVATNNGNRLPWSERPQTAISLEFSIQPQAETFYYLRLNTVSNALLDVQAMTAKEAAEYEIRSFLWQALYIAIILWIIFWALQDYLTRREPVILVFALTYLSYLLYVIAILGYLPAILPDNTVVPEMIFVLVTLAVFTSLLFHRTFLALFEISRLSRWGINLLLFLSLFAAVLLTFGHTQTALKLNSLIALIAGPCLFAVSLSARIERIKIRMYYGLLFFSLFFYAAPILGFTKGSTWTLYGALIQGLVSALLFGHLLYARSQRWAEQKMRAEMQLTLARHQLELHKEQLAEQGQFTDMLTHEIKNPLSAIRFTLDGTTGIPDRPRERIQLALNEINRLVDQCALSDRVERGRLTGTVSLVKIEQVIKECLSRRHEQTRFILSTDAESTTVECSSQPLSIVLNNLIDNALKYSLADSAISITTKSQNSLSGTPGMLIQVANSPGPSGFPEAQQVFDKYYRGQNTSRQQGFGLGLYLVKNLTQQQGWQIDYLPTNEQIVFGLWIPLTPLSAS